MFVIVAGSLLRFRYRNKLMDLLVIEGDRAIEADSLVDLLIEEVDFGLAIVAGLLVAHERLTRFTGG